MLTIKTEKKMFVAENGNPVQDQIGTLWKTLAADGDAIGLLLLNALTQKLEMVASTGEYV